MLRFRAHSLPLVVGLALSLAACDFLGLGKDSSSKTGEKERRHKATASDAVEYIGRASCGSCHEEVVQSYAWSAHDRSLEIAEGDAIEAPFSGEKLTAPPLNLTFEREGTSPVVTAEGSFKVKWTVGYFPLQGYIVEGAGGRDLFLSAIFDNRDKRDGGQKWEMLQGTDKAPQSPGRFPQAQSVFNATCASCHSTGVVKNYNYEKDTYDTKYRELDVSCEACHGPASRHVALAKENEGKDRFPDGIENAGFELPLATYALRRWVRGPDDKVAHLAGDGEAPPEKTEELEACARCHSTARDLGASDDAPFLDFFDRYALAFVTDDLFYADGQARVPVYSYNSLAQSTKHAAGVVCSDCHNPHSGTLRKPANELCASCHDSVHFEAQQHTLHRPDHDVGCVDCHMPERPFIGADMRRDHRFSSPRPDLTLLDGPPSACESCHAHRPKWAATIIAAKMGNDRPPTSATTFLTAEKASADAPEKLAQLLNDPQSPDLLRASALVRWQKLGRFTPPLFLAIEAAAKNGGPLLRRAAAETSSALPTERRAKLQAVLLEDSLRSVRIAAAMASLSGRGHAKPGAHEKKAFEEARTAALFNADQVEGLLDLAALEESIGSPESTNELYELCATRYPQHAVVFEHWVEALKRMGSPEEVQRIVSRGLQLHPTSPVLLFARGRHLVKEGKLREALPLLQKAFDAAPQSVKKEYGYVYAVTVDQLGDWAEGIAILRLLKKEYPEATEIGEALSLFENRRRTK